jgi:hypothetical protein
MIIASADAVNASSRRERVGIAGNRPALERLSPIAS